MTCPPCTHDCEQGKTCPAKNNNEIIAMARQAGFDCYREEITWEDVICTEELKAFAALVAAKEREACAKTLESISNAPDMQAYANIVRLREQA
jgi:predicted transcriptional regulator